MKFKSGIVTAASGSIGGMTFSRNRGGMYIRGRGVPVNPNTGRQAAVRGVFAAMVQAWTNDLDETQRQGWIDYGKDVPVEDSLGEKIQLTGQQMFIRSNTLRVQAGQSVLLDAPTVMNTGVPAFEWDQFGETADPKEFRFEANLAAPAPVAGHALLYVGRIVNAGRRYFNGPYQLAMVTSFNAAATSILFNPEQLIPADGWVSDRTFENGDWVPTKVTLIYEDGRTPMPFRTIVQADTATV